MKKEYLLILLTILIIIAGWFYWFQLRPSNIRKDCYQFTLDKKDEVGVLKKAVANDWYRRCLAEHGLKPEDILKTK